MTLKQKNRFQLFSFVWSFIDAFLLVSEMEYLHVIFNNDDDDDEAQMYLTPSKN